MARSRACAACSFFQRFLVIPAIKDRAELSGAAACPAMRAGSEFSPVSVGSVVVAVSRLVGVTRLVGVAAVVFVIGGTNAAVVGVGASVGVAAVIRFRSITITVVRP